MKRTVVIRSILIPAFLAFFMAASSPAQSGPAVAGDWFSVNTLASVVKLSSVITRYVVDGLPDDYAYATKNGKPDFGKATVVKQGDYFVGVGTGVVLTEEGLIISNAHVTEAYADPSIDDCVGPNGEPMKGKSGSKLKVVLVEKYPGYMFVGAAKKDSIAQGDDRQSLAYVAQVLLDDDDYENEIRDRAVLKIIRYSSLDSDGLPVIGDKVVDAELHIPYSTMGDPFKTSYIDNKVRAIGFPGSGDPKRASKTSGELLGYQSEDSSAILHTSWISNGNSGGGLFYKDALIGINTWDNRKNESRPVGVAQPVTYWDEYFAIARWFIPSMKVPDFSYDWIIDDPSTDDYKKTAEVAFAVVSASDKKTPVTEGKLIAYRSDITIDDVNSYRDAAKTFNALWKLACELWMEPAEKVIAETGADPDIVNALKDIGSKKDLRKLMKDSVLPYYDIWAGDDFYYTIVSLGRIPGKAMLSLPKDVKVNIAYIDSEDNVQDPFVLKVTGAFEQGPYTLPVEK